MSIESSDISSIYQNIVNTGVVFSNRYEVIIFSPPQLTSIGSRQLTLRCESATLPGRSISTVPYRFYGPARNMPYEPIYGSEISITFTLSADLFERRFFEEWMGLVCSRENYKLKYYNEYTTSIQINVLDRTDSVVFSVQLEEAYPKLIGDISMAYDRQDEVMKQDITLNYRKYSIIR